MDESLQGEPSLVSDTTLERLCRTKELDYMSYIVLRLFENTEVRICSHRNTVLLSFAKQHLVSMQVALEDPKRFRVEMTFSRGADLSPLEVVKLQPRRMSLGIETKIYNILACSWFLISQANDRDAASWRQEHTLAINGPERLQEVGSYLTLERMEKMIRPFAMPAEDFPPPTIPQGFSGYFSKSAAVLERLVNLWPFNRNSSHANGK